LLLVVVGRDGLSSPKKKWTLSQGNAIPYCGSAEEGVEAFGVEPPASAA